MQTTVPSIANCMTDMPIAPDSYLCIVIYHSSKENRTVHTKTKLWGCEGLLQSIERILNSSHVFQMQNIRWMAHSFRLI